MRFRRLLVAIAALGLLCPGAATAADGAVSRPWEFTDLAGVDRTIDWQAGAGGVLVFFFDLRSADSLLGLNYCEALASRAGDFGLTVVGVEATGRQPADVRAALQAFAAVYRQPSFPVVADPSAEAAKVFGEQKAPTAVLIGGRGEIVVRRAFFDQGVAVELARGVERLLLRGEGFFSPALRDMGVSEARERELAARAATSAAEVAVEIRALSWGDRLPPFEFVDTAGQAGRWAWPAGDVIRIAFFWSGAAADAAADLAFFEKLRGRKGGQHLEIIAVEATGLGADLVTAALRDGRGGPPARAIRLVADPQRHLAGLFGAGDPLPQTFLIGTRGDVLYRGDGLGPGIRQGLVEKITRAGRLAGLGLPLSPDEVPRPAAADGSEAPSIARRLERDKELRFNLSRGDYFFSNGQYAQAQGHYERYLELEPGYLHAVVRLAQIHDLLGNPARAREQWERVLAINPAHAEALTRLRQLGRGAGQ